MLPTGVVLHPSLHHSRPLEVDLCTLAQPGRRSKAWRRGRFRYISAGSHLVDLRISTKACDSSTLPNNFRSGLVTAPRSPIVTIPWWLLRAIAAGQLTNTGLCGCFSELRIPGYRFLYHIKCSQDEVLTYIRAFPIYFSLYLECPSSVSFSGFLSQLSGRNLPTFSLTHIGESHKDRLNECFLAFRSDNQEIFMVHHVPSTVVGITGDSKDPILCFWREMTEWIQSIQACSVNHFGLI